MPKRKDEQASLTLAGGRDLNVDDVAAIFERITGRKPTAEEIEEARKELEEGDEG